MDMVEAEPFNGTIPGCILKPDEIHGKSSIGRKDGRILALQRSSIAGGLLPFLRRWIIDWMSQNTCAPLLLQIN